MDKIVLSYHDSLLRESDLRLLDTGQWLNDKIIGFMFQYFQYEVFSKNFEEISFLDPDLVHLVKMMPDREIPSILESLNLEPKRFIFLPINDNDDAQAGGSHWSLLIFDAEQECFEHFDSSGDYNHTVAVEVAGKFSKVLKSNKLARMETPQQCNGSDCGVYVVKLTEVICKSKLDASSPWQPSLITNDFIANERENIRRIILTKAGKL
uniref:Sentrin-specific protease 8-like n=1 Tax=Ciona intestinalis TaxID=7719 RepID=A0A1W5BGT3_CIOIN|nr:sentrin-specific protease 8-like [Ciona intestinalis]XP_009861640.1 sentrin-specific protease 8-like [Ciona intestinalis]XP_018671518.1 sentrin-specific protease 8-like [Ciona intestinalis]|eukprot:XP_002125210.1 sentrin-specific protease 8-like [Ciona intestinalis]